MADAVAPVSREEFEEHRAQVQDLWGAMFGSWETDESGHRTGKRKRGIIERLSRLEVALAVVGALVVLRFLGVPTEMVWPLIVHLGH